MNEIHPPTSVARRILTIVLGTLAAVVLLLAVAGGGDNVAYDDQSDVTSSVGDGDSLIYSGTASDGSGISFSSGTRAPEQG